MSNIWVVECELTGGAPGPVFEYTRAEYPNIPGVHRTRSEARRAAEEMQRDADADNVYRGLGAKYKVVKYKRV